ncbi:permease-like cell division protein FtsX [Alysiella filiformis]|uniref:Cell division protein FtsX n=1 Tax=Alysiella filiformis DSM 16848 TaxID=1120981 RepID=A0A286EGL9_9NEIS|nr:permease-like cell division protein FtsX [Alysiella filiformis]QMT31797.1 FtsX-like permease family protein [Alysiella filiformis]UBQ55190.1 permease-like cell division protein FtsX [Alysiella filiformis DSM 16848]SOD70047.1 cell division transport system permease protein [Alysiella filiformis DSM 16848]
MMHYISLHIESAKRAAGYFFKQPIGALLILAMLAIAMTLPLTLYLGVQSSQTVLSKLNETPQITLYLETNANEQDADVIRKLLTEDKRIKSNKFVGKEEGLAEMQAAMNGQDVVSMLDENPLPDVFVVMPADNTPEAITALQADLDKYPMVESTQMDREWMHTLYQLNHLLHQVFYFLAATLGLAFVLVAHNTIRLQILSHKEEIEITKLLGAPSSFVRRPFLYQAAWQSVLSAAISLALATWVMQVSQPLVNQIFKPYGINLAWRTFTPWEIGAVLVLVCALGISGAWLASTQHLLSFNAKRH